MNTDNIVNEIIRASSSLVFKNYESADKKQYEYYDCAGERIEAVVWLILTAIANDMIFADEEKLLLKTIFEKLEQTPQFNFLRKSKKFHSIYMRLNDNNIDLSNICFRKKIEDFNDVLGFVNKYEDKINIYSIVFMISFCDNNLAQGEYTFLKKLAGYFGFTDEERNSIENKLLDLL